MKIAMSLLGGAMLTLLSSTEVKAAQVLWSYATGQGTTTGQIDPTATGSYRYDWANQWAGFGTSSVYVIAPNFVGINGNSALNYATPPGTASWTSQNVLGVVPNLGTYTFIYNFSNPGASTAAVFDMQFLADDKVSNIKLNGTSIFGTSGPVGSWTQITTLDPIPVTVAAGNNVLEVTITNTTFAQGGQVANMGLAATYKISTVSPIPEPGIAALSVVGIAGLVLRRRR